MIAASEVLLAVSEVLLDALTLAIGDTDAAVGRVVGDMVLKIAEFFLTVAVTSGNSTFAGFFCFIAGFAVGYFVGAAVGFEYYILCLESGGPPRCCAVRVNFSAGR